VVLWAKLSKSVSASQVLDPGPNCVEPEFQHFTMSWAAGGPHLRLGLCKGQLQPGPAGFAVFLFRGQRRPQRVSALRFLLLRLHGLTLESSRHLLTIAETGPSHYRTDAVAALLPTIERKSLH